MSKKFFQIHEVDVFTENDLLTSYEKSADVICLLYDASNPTSFAYCAGIYLVFLKPPKLNMFKPRYRNISIAPKCHAQLFLPRAIVLRLNRTMNNSQAIFAIPINSRDHFVFASRILGNPMPKCSLNWHHQQFIRRHIELIVKYWCLGT